LMNERQSDFANPLLQQNSVYTDNSNSLARNNRNYDLMLGGNNNVMNNRP
jgi:hypothetical protein